MVHSIIWVSSYLEFFSSVHLGWSELRGVDEGICVDVMEEMTSIWHLHSVAQKRIVNMDNHGRIRCTQIMLNLIFSNIIHGNLGWNDMVDRWQGDVSEWYLLSFKEDTEALVHGGLVLGSIHLSLLQALDGAELARQSLEQGLAHVKGLKHPFVHWLQLPVNLNLTEDIARLQLIVCSW